MKRRDFFEPDPFEVFLAIVTVAFGIIFAIFMLSGCEKADDYHEGEAALCDFVCINTEDGDNKCEWTCEDPTIEVICNHCAYRVQSGTAFFDCGSCDYGTYDETDR